MKLLLVSATGFEMAAILKHIEENGRKLNFFEYEYHGIHIFPLVTGIAAMKTAFSIARYCHDKTFDLAINVGVCGAFQNKFELGDVLQVIDDRFADLGVEEKDGSFTDTFELELEDPNKFPFNGGSISNHSYEYYELPTARAITVNTSHGTQASINSISDKYNFDVESMEGAAFFYACKALDIRCHQIRSVSNYIEPRNKDNWELSMALENLSKEVIRLLDASVPYLNKLIRS